MSSSKQETSNKPNHKLITQELEEIEELYEIPTLPHIPKLYDNILDDKLRDYFIVAHSIILESYQFVNNSLSTNCYFHAPKSRRLRACIKSLFNLQKKLSDTPLSFKIDPYYTSIFTESLNVIADGPSNLPKDWETVRLPNSKPIFTLLNAINIEHTPTHIMASELHEIGKGSFATVYKFHDSFLNRELALKVANEDLNKKELERFSLEYETLARLNSPNIVEVYNYDKELHRYTMEYLPYSLSSYYKQTSITLEKRIDIAKQVCSAVQYLISKESFHRDLSPNNVLIKEYDDGTIVAKLSDFGLVKTPDFKKTDYLSDPKGTYIPREVLLRQVAFKDFGKLQELSSLTDLLFYIMNGFDYDENEDANNVYINAYKAGTNVDLDKRIDNVPELLRLFLAASSRVSH